MCEEFSLEFTPEKGIVAWMNQDIMDEFSGPGMQFGDEWKVYLGRRVKLDPDDLDGTLFIEGILEDGILCHSKSWDRPRWVTIKEGAGIWATLPNPDLENPLDLNYDWCADEGGPYRFCVVDPVTGARGEIPANQWDSDSDSDEESNGHPQPPALQNLYGSDDDEGEDGEERAVKVEEEEERTSLSGVDSTVDLGIAMEDGEEEDMEWEEQSTDPSSCDSDFYDTD
jgi:hypothetical protein